MQEVSCAARTRQGPVILLTPLVSAHHEEVYGLGMRERVGNVFEEIVVLAQSSFLLIKRGGGAEINIANLTAGTGVAADRDQEALSSTRGFVLAMRLHSNVVA